MQGPYHPITSALGLTVPLETPRASLANGIGVPTNGIGVPEGQSVELSVLEGAAVKLLNMSGSSRNLTLQAGLSWSELITGPRRLNRKRDCTRATA